MDEERDPQAPEEETDQEAQGVGVGGLGDHPAPAAMRDPESGVLRQHGEPLHSAGNEAPAEVGVGGLTDEARAKLEAETEPAQLKTRPDTGTSDEED